MRPIDIARKVAPLARQEYLDALERGDPLFASFEINSPLRVAHFLAQILHESGGLRLERENMNYRAERMLEIFGPSHSAKITPGEAAALEGKPEAIAERVYGLGNPVKASELGNRNPGDGFRYRGGGLMQTTGRANYRRMGELAGVDFENNPEFVTSAEHALKPALAEWKQTKLNPFADADDLLTISRGINLGNTQTNRTPNGMADRKDWLDKAKAAIGSAAIELRPAGAGGVSAGVVGTGTPPPVAAAGVARIAGREMNLREVQRRLAEMGLYLDEIDGDYGPNTRTAILALFNNQAVRETDDWDELRHIIGAGQVFCRIDGIETGAIDGFLGPQTRFAFDVYAGRNPALAGEPSWRDNEEEVVSDDAAPVVASAAATNWPRERDVISFYGAPGSGQTMLTLPFKMRLAWDLSASVGKTSCHKKVKDNLERIWVRTLEHYGIDEIRRLRLDLFGGCLNVRKKRGGSGWSMHAFGIAWDVDPEHNQLKMGRDEATLDASEYDAFWGFVEAEGALSLGRARNFDWMHFQFARL